MNLSEVKDHLTGLQHIRFVLPTGELVPKHFHVTEVGIVNKRFIDCGGTVRDESVVSFQLWNADDYDHRLHPDKLLKIIKLSEKVLSINDDLEVEVEYQGTSIEKYGLDFGEGDFLLTSKHTDCLAKDNCGIPEGKPKVNLATLTSTSCCTPGGDCC